MILDPIVGRPLSVFRFCYFDFVIELTFLTFVRLRELFFNFFFIIMFWFRFYGSWKMANPSPKPVVYSRTQNEKKEKSVEFQLLEELTKTSSSPSLLVSRE